MIQLGDKIRLSFKMTGYIKGKRLRHYEEAVHGLITFHKSRIEHLNGSVGIHIQRADPLCTRFINECLDEIRRMAMRIQVLQYKLQISKIMSVA